MNEQISNLKNQLFELLNSNKLNEGIVFIDEIVSNKNKFDIAQIPVMSVIFSSFYIDIAEQIIHTLGKDFTKEANLKQLAKAKDIILKMFGIFNQNSQLSEYESFFESNRARGYLTLYDIDYIKNNHVETSNYGSINFDLKPSIYTIDNYLTKSISSYWLALENCIDLDEKYNIRNNLANALSRVGRFIEAVEMYNKNISNLPLRWQSNASLVDTLDLLVEKSFIPKTVSLSMKKAYLLKNSLDNIELNPFQRQSLSLKLAQEIAIIEQNNFEFNIQTINTNEKEEEQDFELFSEYRKFTIKNQLSLNEHSLYCNCRDSKIDNLKIGLLQGSLHENKNLIILDSIANRMISEFAYSRMLYFSYKSDFAISINDIEYATIKNHSNVDIYGYKIENLRTSYRLAYSILDKIGNAILMLYNIKKDIHVCFETLFTNEEIKLELSEKSNIHLTALYSLSIDLNKDKGVFREFKKIRNEMEHGYYPIDIANKSEIEVANFTLNLLQLTRKAIFSFIFLTRTETIIGE